MKKIASGPDLDYKVNLKNELSLAEVLRRLDVLESERLPKLFEEQNTKLLAGRNSGSQSKVDRNRTLRPLKYDSSNLFRFQWSDH